MDIATWSSRGDGGDNDEFIFTLSDHDCLSGSTPSQVDGKRTGRVGNKKRKRQEDDGRNSGPKALKGKQTVRESKIRRSEGQRTPEEAVSKPERVGRAEGGGDEDDDVEEGSDDDGALDPEFEFQVPGLVLSEDEEGFDAWDGHGRRQGGNTKADAEMKPSRKSAADVDEIIRRRRAAKMTAKDETSREALDQSHDGPEELEPERMRELNKEQKLEIGGYEDEDDNMDGASPRSFLAFDDDDVLAPDDFGAGEALEDEDDQSEHMSNINDYDSSGRDDDSIASPTAHPDDVASAASDSETSVEDAEEASKRAAFFAPEPGNDHAPSSSAAATTSASFHSFSLSRPILKGLSILGFTKPTPIQQKTIPIALLGKDVVGSAVTGSGKTAAFLLPILERLLYRPRKVPTTRVAILMPTRELAVQCHAVAAKLASYTDTSFAQLVGGFSLREQEAVLKRRPDVVIATPGRFIDHMRNSTSFTIDTLEILVLDEADRMLQDGFAAELNEIIASIPKNRQTMLFSATMTESVDSLIRVGLNRPVRLMIDRQASTVTTLTQEFVRLRPGRENKRLACLVQLCKQAHTSRVIVFCREKKTAHRIRIIFSLLDLRAGELHGSMTQEQRINAVEAFRAGKTDFLLATDLASRGLDIRGVETVINFEAPASHDIYLHRVGRTARAGKTGRACTLAAEPDRKVVKAAVKSAAAQGSRVVSRVVDAAEADAWSERLDELDPEVEDVLREEKQERQLAQVESEVRRADNLIDHRDEIMARPRRTWFETERDKKDRKSQLGDRIEDSKHKKLVPKDGKLSGKEKRRLDSRRDRMEGGSQEKVWKKSKAGTVETGRGGRAATSGRGSGKGKESGEGRAEGREKGNQDVKKAARKSDRKPQGKERGKGRKKT